MNQEESSAVIALYGARDGTLPLASFFSNSVAWMVGLGHAPTLASISRLGRASKPTPFDRIESEVRKKGFNAVDGISLFSLLPEGSVPMRDYLLLASYSAVGGYAIITGRSSIVSLVALNSSPLMAGLVCDLQPQYGIGFERAQGLGPVAYAMGIAEGLGFSGEQYKEAVAISRWGHAGMPQRVYARGVLRGVYPWNLLSEAHLARLIDGRPLIDWIQEGKGARGSLARLCDGVFVWTLAAEDVASVRKSIEANELLLES